MEFNTISVVGLGYIGLPTAAVIASRRKRVIGVDVNQHTVDTINRGDIHIVEPELDIVVQSVVTQGYLSAATSPKPADAFLIAVPTPFKAESDDDHVPDLAYIEQASKAIAKVLDLGNLVILESTSPVGSTEQMAKWLAEARPDLTFPQTHGEDSDVRIAHCPERVLPGHVIRELVENDRVIGGMTPKCSAAATALYKTFVEGECITATARTAEMAKLTENSFRDVNIAFANELSLICDKEGINVWDLIQLANHHPRVNILQPGTGVGGHCIAVDPWFIVARDAANARMIRTAREVNNHKTEWVIEKIKLAAADANARTGLKPKIACLGLAFKPDIDDLRESPALEVAEALLVQGYDVVAVEPNIDDHASLPLLSLKAATKEADVIAVLVKHREFMQPDVRSNLSDLGAIDFCGALA